jgi:hypothetical protein
MSRRRGNEAENAVCAQAEALGYCAFAARGSRGPVDIVCFEDLNRSPWERGVETFDNRLVPLVIQVGSAEKAISRTLEALLSAPRPLGSLCIVSRRIRAANGRISWLHHRLTPEGKAAKFLTLAEAINGEAVARPAVPKKVKRLRRAGAGAKKDRDDRARAPRAARASG